MILNVMHLPAMEDLDLLELGGAVSWVEPTEASQVQDSGHGLGSSAKICSCLAFRGGVAVNMNMECGELGSAT